MSNKDNANDTPPTDPLEQGPKTVQVLKALPNDPMILGTPVTQGRQVTKGENVQRVAINLSESEIQLLKGLARALDLNMAETVRRSIAVTRYLVEEARKEDRTVTIKKTDGTFVDIFL